MNGKSLSLRHPSSIRSLLLLALSGSMLLASGCVTYRAHINVLPDGKVQITEHAEAEPGILDTLHVDPRLAWTAFEATVGSRGGQVVKDQPDTLKGATGTYELDSWNELGQRGQAFKSIDEGEKRLRPAQAGYEVKDQYFYKDTTLGFRQQISEPDNATVDSLALPYAQKATGTLEIEVPGTILTTNAPKRAGNVLTYPLAYDTNLDVKVTYREWQWVSMVSVVLVAIFLGYLAFSGLKSLTRKKGSPKKA